MSATSITKPVTRRAGDATDADGRPLLATLGPADVLELRPQGVRRATHARQLRLAQLWQLAAPADALPFTAAPSAGGGLVDVAELRAAAAIEPHPPGVTEALDHLLADVLAQVQPATRFASLPNQTQHQA